MIRCFVNKKIEALQKKFKTYGIITICLITPLFIIFCLLVIAIIAYHGYRTWGCNKICMKYYTEEECSSSGECYVSLHDDAESCFFECDKGGGKNCAQECKVKTGLTSPTYISNPRYE
jgi:hypothetical protein